MEKILEIFNLKKSYNNTEVLKDISLSVNKGEVISILGSSGSGKSTLLRSINLLEMPDGGIIRYFKNNDIVEVFNKRIPKELNLDMFRSEVSMVFQNFNLFNNLTVLENLTIGQIKVLKLSKEEARKIALDKLNLVGLNGFENRNVQTLSGGQKQRVAIARSLCMRPNILLFDEPTSALDPEMVDEVLSVMKDIAKSGLTLIIVTHEMAFANDVSTRIVFMDEGKILCDASTFDFFNNSNIKRVNEFIKRYKTR